MRSDPAPGLTPTALLAGFAAVLAILISVWQIEAASAPLTVRQIAIGQTPATVRTRTGAPPAPAVVIAHGFAGSRQLMDPLAVSLARAGYVAVSFDFPGHGANPVPMTGDVTREDGATAALQIALATVIGAARDLPGTDGRVAVLGHSMASDIIVREAVRDPGIAATVAISMFSEQVTATAPGNLLMIVGGWEGFLARAALDALALSAGPEAREGQTFGDAQAGTARRLALADGVEHVGVLYSRETLAESIAWLDLVFGRAAPDTAEWRAPWLGLLFAGVIVLAWPLSRLLPRVGGGPRRALGPWQSGVAALAPAVATPLILWPVETDVLPVLVAGYMAMHFAVYGALTAIALGAFVGLNRPSWPGPGLILAAAAASLYGIFALGIPLDRYVASFLPHAGRVPVIAALSAGALIYALADAWFLRRPGVPVWAMPLSRTAFLASLALAIALDLEGLFFLIIIAPVILLFFVIYGLMAGWVHARVGHPGAAGIATGLAFGWALGVTFPLLAP